MVADSAILTGRFARWSAVVGMAATVLFLPVTFVIGAIREDYDPVSQHISALAETGAPHAWAQTTNFVLFGLAVLVLALGLHSGISGGRGSILGPLLIATFGLLAGIGNGLFPADPVGAPETTVGTLHELTAAIGFSSLIVSMFVLARRLRHDGSWQALATPSKWTGVLAALLMLLFLLAAEVEGFLDGYSGLVQRIFAVTVLAWLFALSLRLYRTSARPGR